MRSVWYIERWVRVGRKAEEHETLADPRSVFTVIKILKRICPRDIIRVLAPETATAEEIAHLKSLGAVLA
jgi:hypothetical protein